MLQINPHIRPRRHAPKRTPQLPIMHPDLDILAIKEQIQPPGVVQMQMPDNNLLHILDPIPRSLDLRVELGIRGGNREAGVRVRLAQAGEGKAGVEDLAGERGSFLGEGAGFGVV